jgi:hypothetical protein
LAFSTVAHAKKERTLYRAREREKNQQKRLGCGLHHLRERRGRKFCRDAAAALATMKKVFPATWFFCRNPPGAAASGPEPPTRQPDDCVKPRLRRAHVRAW